MDNSCERLFSHFPQYDPPRDLFENVVKRIEDEKNFQKIRRKTLFFAVSTILCAIACVPALIMVRSSANESGFMKFFSLLFSDFQSVVSYWQSFSLTLLETLPVASLIMLSTILLLFLESLRSLANGVKSLFKFKNNTFLRLWT